MIKQLSSSYTRRGECESRGSLDLLDRSVVGVWCGVAHHLVPLLRVAGVLRRHVLVARVWTVGVTVLAVALRLGCHHRPLDVGRLVLGQC